MARTQLLRKESQPSKSLWKPFWRERTLKSIIALREREKMESQRKKSINTMRLILMRK